MTTTETNHALANAKAHMDSIRELYEAHETIAERRMTPQFRQGVIVDDETYHEPEDVEERARESALCVEVRSGWHDPGKDGEPAEKYRVTLTTGGPALCLQGNLTMHGEPETADLYYQDWGTPWIIYTQTVGDCDALEWFASLFYYGE